ncbi:TPA: hypothetical protein ACKRQV_001261 [Pseudomonas aeruginosa]|nr:hypothetical protein [Pseudomonas aeruginosa]
MISETEQQNQNTDSPGGTFAKFANAACAVALLAIFLYLAVCIAASSWLTFHVPITDEDMRNASFLTWRLGLAWHGAAFGLLITLFGAMNVLGGRLLGVSLMVMGMSIVFATSEVSALRQGILDGDLKIGCYTYVSLECRKQLGVPAGEANSIFKDPSAMGQGGYAPWYEPIRVAADSNVTAILPNTIPGVAFVQSPLLVMKHMDELKKLVASQREEVAHYKAALAKP